MKLVNEDITNFERGLDPKRAMSTGLAATLEPLLKKFVMYNESSALVSKLMVNRWELEILLIRFKSEKKMIHDLDNELKRMGLSHFLVMPAHSVKDLNFEHSIVLYKFKPEFVGIFGQEAIQIEESLQFQRGLEPKQAMGIGLEAQIQKYADAQDISGGSNEDILDHLLNYDLGSDSIDEETKKTYIDWLLKHMDIEYVDENVIDALHGMDWNLVPYFKKYPGGNFTIKKTPTNYVIITRDWDNFVDYFQDENRYGKYIAGVLSGDAMEYFMYDYSKDYEDKLDIYDLEYMSPSEYGDVFEELAKLQFPNKQKQIEFFQKSKSVGPFFDFIWAQAKSNVIGFRKLKNAILRAASETLEAGNTYAAFKDLTKQITDHFDMTLIKSVDLKFKITEKGLNRLIYAHWLHETRIDYHEQENYGDFDVSVFHDCFDNAIND